MQVAPLSFIPQRDLSPKHVREPGHDFRHLLLTKVSRPPLLHPEFAPGTTTRPLTASERVFLGTLSQATPTVSQLLYQHMEYADNWWEIVHSSRNRNIDYRHLLPGTEVFLEKNSGALVLVAPRKQNHIQTEAAIAPGKPPLHGRISLGAINKNAPTVSHLLEQNDRTRADTWKILDKPINRHKNFTDIRPGTEIFLDYANGELIWSSPQKNGSYVARQPSEVAPAAPAISTSTRGAYQLVSLGKISPATPTVSHLLVGNDRFRDKAWQILFSEVNRDKRYTDLRNGTEIFLKPETGELLWGDAVVTRDRQAPLTASLRNAPAMTELSPHHTPRSEDSQAFSSRLASAVKTYFGRPYNEINCYDLVVRGLQRMGIKYLGSGGIRERLVRLATEKGLPPNAFFNGEGLIQATGKKVFSRTYLRVRNAAKEADRLFRDISSKLQKGDILSFSTESNGHTGIISREGQQWTFINSGDLDNTVSNRPHPAEGVGEEDLHAEIKNWLEKAHAERQSLQVTLGRLEEDKLRTAMQRHGPILSSTL